MAQAGLTARRTCRADAKAEHSEPTVRIRCGRRLTDKSYPGDNRLVPPKRSERRRSSAPRCRLDLSWGWRRSQGFGCSPIKKLRELGSNRRETGWSPICCRRWFLRRFNSSKCLLLQKVISDDNVANNGGGFNARKALRSKAFGKCVEVNTVGSRNQLVGCRF